MQSHVHENLIIMFALADSYQVRIFPFRFYLVAFHLIKMQYSHLSVTYSVLHEIHFSEPRVASVEF